MALTTDGKLLLAANNAEDPPYATLFAANGDDATEHTSIIIKTTIDPTILPAGFGLSMEQPVWIARPGGSIHRSRLPPTTRRVAIAAS